MVATISASPMAFRPSPIHPGDDQFVPLAVELGTDFATRAAQHDRDNTFVHENYDRMKASGYTPETGAS